MANRFRATYLSERLYHYTISLGLFIGVLNVSPLQATVISTATISGQQCEASQMNTGLSSAVANASCLASGASAGSSFDIGSPSLSNLAFSSNAQPFNVSTSTASFLNTFAVIGGSGTGFLALDFVSSISGVNDPQASANATLNVALNSAVLDNTRVCGNAPATGGPFNCSGTVPIGFAFSYDTPFTLNISLTGVAGGGMGGSNISGSGQFTYTILNAAGGPANPNGTLTLVPEPSSALLLLPALLLFVTLARFRHAGVTHRLVSPPASHN